jgi:3-oxoacyl-[acyl-carrier protein] reductase
MSRPVAVITGAGRGIGRATALELGRGGYGLVLVARTGEELAETVRLVEGEGGRGGAGNPGAVAVPADVTRSDEVDQVVLGAVERFGRVDAIVHCAGVAPVRSIGEMTAAEWREVIETNLSAAFYLCRAAWPVFERQRSGVVVNISSLSARDPFPGFAAYGAAKAGLNLFGLSAAREGERIGVRVHTIAPGAVETAMFRRLATPEQWPAEKALDPADVAKVIAACVRGDLRYTSGEVIYLHKTV